MTFGVTINGSKKGVPYTEQDVAAVRNFHERLAAMVDEFRASNPDIDFSGSMGIPAVPGENYETLPL